MLLIDHLRPTQEMFTLDVAPETEELEEHALTFFGYSVLSGAFVASYPKMRAALYTDTLAKRNDLSQCDCDLKSEPTMKF